MLYVYPQRWRDDTNWGCRVGYEQEEDDGALEILKEMAEGDPAVLAVLLELRANMINGHDALVDKLSERTITFGEFLQRTGDLLIEFKDKASVYVNRAILDDIFSR